MHFNIPSDWRSARLAIALSLVVLAILGSAALANASRPPVETDGGIGGDIVLPVEPDGGIGGDIVLPVEPDGGIGGEVILPVEPDGGIGN